VNDAPDVVAVGRGPERFDVVVVGPGPARLVVVVSGSSASVVVVTPGALVAVVVVVVGSGSVQLHLGSHCSGGGFRGHFPASAVVLKATTARATIRLASSARPQGTA
jgi:hypothetical protein